MTVSLLKSAITPVRYAISFPSIRNGVAVATAALVARKYEGQLGGVITLGLGLVATYEFSSNPYRSAICAVSLYYLPKALELAIQTTASEALKAAARGLLSIALAGGSLVLKKVSLLREKSHPTKELAQSSPVQSELPAPQVSLFIEQKLELELALRKIEELRRENLALKQKLESLSLRRAKPQTPRAKRALPLEKSDCVAKHTRQATRRVRASFNDKIAGK